MISRSRKIVLAVAALSTVCFGSLVYVTGAIDYVPRLRVMAQSPNGEFTVKVYQQRLSPRPFFPRMGAIAKVYDKNDNLIFEKTIQADDDWDDTLGDCLTQILFVEEEIRIGPGCYVRDKFVIIKLNELNYLK